MNTPSTNVCRYNCICNKDSCTFSHFIEYDQRIALYNGLNDIPDIDSYRYEDYPMIRKKTCTFGQLCNNKACTFKHGFNPDGRMLIITKHNALKKEAKMAAAKPKVQRTEPLIPVCEENCLCGVEKCGMQHYMTFSQRTKLIAISIEKASELETCMTEDNQDKRTKMCIFGQMCNRENCTFKHGLNITGRMILIESYKDAKKN